MNWISLAVEVPRHEVLVWSEGKYFVAILVPSQSGADNAGDFMDVNSSNLLPWPSHWAELPEPPLGARGCHPVSIHG
jgi:hypothetical protein